MAPKLELNAALERGVASMGRLMGPHVGVDVVHIPSLERRMQTGGDAFLSRIFTQEELRFAVGRLERLATRLAAKEAVLKALGTGIRGIGLREIEIRVDPNGKPTISLKGSAARRATELRLEGVAISLSHEAGYAVALAAGY